MSDTVYVIRYIGMVSGVSRARARDPLLSHCIFSARESSPAFRPSPSHPFSSPPSYCLRVKQKLHRWRCRPTLDMGFQLFSSTSKRLSTRSCDFHACKGSIHFRLPLGRIARNCYTLAKRTIDRLLHDTYKVFVIGWQSESNRDSDNRGNYGIIYRLLNLNNIIIHMVSFR